MLAPRAARRGARCPTFRSSTATCTSGTRPTSGCPGSTATPSSTSRTGWPSTASTPPGSRSRRWSTCRSRSSRPTALLEADGSSSARARTRASRRSWPGPRCEFGEQSRAYLDALVAVSPLVTRRAPPHPGRAELGVLRATRASSAACSCCPSTASPSTSASSTRSCPRRSTWCGSARTSASSSTTSASPTSQAGLLEPWREQIARAGRASRTSICKVSGMVTEADTQRWTAGRPAPIRRARARVVRRGSRRSSAATGRSPSRPPPLPALGRRRSTG